MPETDQPENWAHRGGAALSAAASDVDLSGFFACLISFCYFPFALNEIAGIKNLEFFFGKSMKEVFGSV